MIINELRTRKLTAREWLICQYAKESMLIACEGVRSAIKDKNGKSLGSVLQDLECEARMIGDDETQLKNCLCLSQLIA